MFKKLGLFVCIFLLINTVGIVAQDEETFALTILHTNDTHSHHEPNSAGDGGAA